MKRDAPPSTLTDSRGDMGQDVTHDAGPTTLSRLFASFILDVNHGQCKCKSLLQLTVHTSSSQPGEGWLGFAASKQSMLAPLPPFPFNSSALGARSVDRRLVVWGRTSTPSKPRKRGVPRATYTSNPLHRSLGQKLAKPSKTNNSIMARAMKVEITMIGRNERLMPENCDLWTRVRRIRSNGNQR